MSARKQSRSLSAAVIRAYLSLSYKVEDDEAGAPPQLITRLMLPLPLTLAGLVYLVLSALLDPIVAIFSGAWSALWHWLREQYIWFFVWLGAEPPPGYEYLLRECAMEVIYA